MQCQSTWLYLEPIFSSEDILAQMPEEGRKFGIVDSYWKDIMVEAIKDNHCLVATGQKNMLSRLQDSNVLLDEIQKGLNAYLEKKRLYFPRWEFALALDVLLDTIQSCFNGNSACLLHDDKQKDMIRIFVYFGNKAKPERL